MDYLELNYTEENGNLKGETKEYQFKWDQERQCFWKIPEGKRISHINIYQTVKGIPGARQAAIELKKIFEQKQPKRGLPKLTLEYHDWLKDQGIDEDTAKEYECGKCNKGIFSGHIVFRTDSGHYLGYNFKSKKWKFPPSKFGFRRDFLYNWIRNSKADKLQITNDIIRCISEKLPTVCIMGKTITDGQLEYLQGKMVTLLEKNDSNLIKLAKIAYVTVN